MQEYTLSINIGIINLILKIFRLNVEKLILKILILIKLKPNIPQPRYNTIVGVQANFRVSFPIRVITRVKCIVI